MPAIPPEELLAEAACYACYGASSSDLLKLALWDRIAQTSSDPVQSFIDRSGITDPTQIAAVTSLQAAAVANGWWDKCDLIYPFVGGTAQAHSINLKSLMFSITWFGTVTHNANGITGNGIDGYGDTAYIPSTSGQMLLNSTHLSVYRRSAELNTRTFAGTSVGSQSRISATVVGTSIAHRVNDASNTVIALVGLGFTTTSRLDAIAKHLYVSGLDNSSGVASTSVPTGSLYVLATNPLGIGPSPANLAGMTAGSGLTFVEYTAMAADWQTFQTSLGRQV